MLKKIVPFCLRYRHNVLLKTLGDDRFISSTVYCQLPRRSRRSGEENIQKSSLFAADSVCNEPVQSVLTPVVLDQKDAIKSFTRTEDVLKFLRTNKNISHDLYANIFMNIRKLQKSGCTKVTNENIIKSPEFDSFCSKVEKNVRFLNAHDAVGIFSSLMFLNLSPNCLLAQSILQIICKNVNKLSLSSLTFLASSLRNCSTSPLVEGLKIAVPAVFDTNIRFQLNREKNTEVFDCFLYAFKERALSKETLEFLIQTALGIENEFTALQSLRMAFAICKLNLKLTDRMRLYDHLLKNVVNKVDEKLSFSELKYFIHVMFNAYIRHDEAFYNEDIVQLAIKRVIDQQLSIIETGNLLRQLSRISYPCYKLLDYMDEKLALESDFENVNSLEPFIGYLNCCSNCVYKPKNWPLYQDKFVSLIEKKKNEPIPLLKIVIDLIVMKCWVTSLIDHCFGDEFIRKMQSRENNTVDYLSILRLYQIVKTIYPGGYKNKLPPLSVIEKAANIEISRNDFPLEGALIHAFGGSEYVLSGVGTRLSHFIDHLIVKSKSGKMVVINENKVRGTSGKMVESLEYPEESLLIGIMLLSPASYCLDGMKIRGKVKLKIHSLESLGIAVIPVSQVGWMNLPDREKIPYLMNKIETRTFVNYLDNEDTGLIRL